jgi:exodeoxyribonuclease V alpha subunit
VTRFIPLGTAREAWLRAGATDHAVGASAIPIVTDPEDFEPAYLGWEIARCAPGLSEAEQRALAGLAAACVLSMRAGSTRLPLKGAPLATALAAAGFPDVRTAGLALVERARAAVADDPVATAIGRPGDRKPLVVEGDWLYAERMYALEERFCARLRARASHPQHALSATDTRALGRAVTAVASGPPPLTDEQKRAVRQGLAAPLVLITGGPGTGKTATAVALVRAIAWMGTPMEQLAIAAPPGKAAQRLADAMALGLSQSHDLADAGLRAIAPAPQTLHRLLGWSPSRGRFARHENDRLPYRFVLVDEASMIDLAMMDRLVRALRDDARLVLLGDADQLPSIEAGAVFRDLCAGLGGARLTVNLRVANDPDARRITGAAHAVNAGTIDATFVDAVRVKPSVDAITFEGVEHLAAPWSEAGDAVLDRWWRERVAAREGFARRSTRVFRASAAGFEEGDRAELRTLFDDHARCRILCVTRVRGFSSSADVINDRLAARLRRETSPDTWQRARGLGPGTLVAVQRNDYERGLYNGDQGLVIRVASSAGDDARLMVVFPRGASFEAFPLDVIGDVAPAFAMTVHKAQGSEFDHVAIVLPDADLPLLTRELLYTAMTRARRSVLIVGPQELLARAVSRTVERFSGVAERLKNR